MESFEEKYEDVLQNSEFEIVRMYQHEPELLDLHVEDALGALIAAYQAERQGRAPRAPTLSRLAEDVRASVQGACDWRLGREPLIDAEPGAPLPMPAPLTLDEMLTCLKRVRKSVRYWSKEGGRQGYLRFVSDFVG